MHIAGARSRAHNLHSSMSTTTSSTSTTTLLVWGLAGGQRGVGQVVSGAAPGALRGAWNPDVSSPPPDQQQLPVPPAEVAHKAAGWTHTLVVSTSGDVLLSSGDDSEQWQSLQLDGSLLTASGPAAAQLPSALTAVTQVAAGDGHCLLLTAGGAVWALGSNRNGQLGEQTPAGSSTTQPRPVLGPGVQDSSCAEPLQQVAAGAAHSAAVSASGRLFVWGWNGNGQCCNGDTTDVARPQLCAALDGVPLAAVATGMAHTVCCSRDGAVYACGWNSSGQLGTGGGGTESSKGSDGQQQQQHGMEQLAGMSSLTPVLLEHPAELADAHVVQVACGSRHTLVLTAAGAVYAWGWNDWAQCCTRDTADAVWAPRRLELAQHQRAVAVWAGRWHSCVEVAAAGG